MIVGSPRSKPGTKKHLFNTSPNIAKEAVKSTEIEMRSEIRRILIYSVTLKFRTRCFTVLLIKPIFICKDLYTTKITNNIK